MSLSVRRRHGIDIWPGFVDALASILMVFIFMLLIFVIAQLFLSDVLAGREGALKQLSRGINELLETLSIEQDRTTELSNEVKRLSAQLELARAERNELGEQLAVTVRHAEESAAQARALKLGLEAAERTAAVDRDKLTLRLREIASLQQDLLALREARAKLEAEVGGLASSLSTRNDELAAARDRSKALVARLASEEERTRLSQVEVERSDIRLKALSRQVSDYQAALAGEQRLSESARSEVALLNDQIAALRARIEGLSAALDLKNMEAEGYKVEIKKLGARLNLALARKVEELDRFRSDFFGRLREVLGDNPDIQVVGDRFLFKSELLFPSARAVLEPEGRDQLDRLAETLKAVSANIPPDLDWILRIDGHTDHHPIQTADFPSNWELSTARALSVVKHLVGRGIPPHRLAAAGFGEFRPIDPAETPAAYARNRRIELKLTGP